MHRLEHTTDTEQEDSHSHTDSDTSALFSSVHHTKVELSELLQTCPWRRRLLPCIRHPIDSLESWTAAGFPLPHLIFPRLDLIARCRCICTAALVDGVRENASEEKDEDEVPCCRTGTHVTLEPRIALPKGDCFPERRRSALHVSIKQESQDICSSKGDTRAAQGNHRCLDQRFYSRTSLLC
ncbi:hypothetical protein CCUS01_08242 [Colletotrichum cuscutae]|uniref:Uncharacterized protein n=1 Tax=Colletotrichum cuscutae TaxID=1209917 RepID=A0AAI9UUT7_9PEZI|nr:hypothetical protein CCUS01_08242 [Colletotrichum cuscutae]